MKYIKHPRIYHVPWSSPAKDDAYIKDMQSFEGERVVVYEKYDGENFSLYNDKVHARSIDSQYEHYQSALYGIYSQIAYWIPDEWRICGEYMYAKHEIYYDQLPSYFIAHSIWNKYNWCFSVDEFNVATQILKLSTPNVVYEGKYNKFNIIDAFENYKERQNREIEGYVIRKCKEFHYNEYNDNVVKYVRPNHVKTNEHWKYSGKALTYNKLRKNL